MTDSSSHILNESPDAIANRLMKKADNRDGLLEIAIGVLLLTMAGTVWLQVVCPRGSYGYKAANWGLMLLVPALCLGSQWAIKWVRRQFLIERVGYVELKPVSRKWLGIVLAIAFSVAAAVTFALYKSLPPTNWLLVGTGIFEGMFAAFVGRLPRFIAGGAVLAATGIVLAFTGVSIDMGIAILFGFAGLLTLVSGCVVLLLFVRKPAETGE
jgi:hypothetical protein